MHAVILVGGKGSRLKSEVPDKPKPMADISGKPFLEYLFAYLEKEGITEIILSAGYKHQAIIDYFGPSYQSINIQYSIENSPLGTGGAIKKALELSNSKNTLILNGDTFFPVDIKEMYNKHLSCGRELTIALKKMYNFKRYGNVILKHGHINKFEEKKHTAEGFINGGVYIFSDFPALLPSKEYFSFETDFMETAVNKMKINAYKSDAYFIDIGIPEDYHRACNELPELFQ